MSALGKRGGLNIIRITGLVEVTAPPPGAFASSRLGARRFHRAGAWGRGLVGAARSQPAPPDPGWRLWIRLRQVRRSLRRRASTSSGRAPALDGTQPDRDGARRHDAFAPPSEQ